MRLIDADEMAANDSEAYMSAQTKIDSPITLGLNSVVHREIQQLIADTPTVDAMEVVRCKDCKYYCQDKINGVICRHPALDFDTECFDHWINTNPDDFCSYGEKEGADNEP